MATTSMDNSPTANNSRVWWGIAIVAAIVIAILFMSRSPRDSQNLSGSSSAAQSRNTGTTSTPGTTTYNGAANTNGAAATTTDSAAPAAGQPVNPSASPDTTVPTAPNR